MKVGCLYYTLILTPDILHVVCYFVLFSYKALYIENKNVKNAKIVSKKG